MAAPVVVAHRGMSGELHEHTLAAHRAALLAGADALEVDVVPTADGVLVVRHENELSMTTDVADRPEFAHRRTTKVVDQQLVSGWFVEEFTRAEVASLRVRERLPHLRPQVAVGDDMLGVATLGQVLDLVAEFSVLRGRPVGLYVELKHATHFGGCGLPVDDLLLAELGARGLTGAGSPVQVLAFETTVLRRIADRARLPVVQLLDHPRLAPADLVAAGDPRTYADLVTSDGLAWIDGWADGIGARTDLVRPVGRDGHRTAPTALVREAHRLGMTVAVWTLRAENRFLPPARWSGTLGGTRGDLAGDVTDFVEAGVDALVTDHPHLALPVLGR